jgi:hypothetical protein
LISNGYIASFIGSFLTVFLFVSIVAVPISMSHIFQPADAFDLNIHKQITSDVLSFLKPEILAQIDQGHDEADGIGAGENQFLFPYHFDNCNFLAHII